MHVTTCYVLRATSYIHIPNPHSPRPTPAPTPASAIDRRRDRGASVGLPATCMLRCGAMRACPFARVRACLFVCLPRWMNGWMGGWLAGFRLWR
ncbi:uncharacterized protein K452DRAFT_40027 [Aplosporella prunicola CBS 121167]|uniref:Uncharacterized protein n=1 Tax=Aplosporella prunicola CBS 121167 TaxID=1176127 RepID=A0A6A6BBI7_9PEZI|nr:uncharacterized protein K452DRAFT_40027 [Aplosporella prunicola CBS 121167]KAF2141480.1 hypothetical protein K452DRAFT_40027 [Aplosporella prunicola CBS 121167]